MTDSDCGLKFIIVGASVAGLASAIALKNSGHSVLVLEKELHLGGLGSVPNGSGCAELPPNGSKILLGDWGLEAEVAANSAPIAGFSAYKYAAVSSPDLLGYNLWDPELVNETRGGYQQFLHRDLIHVLCNLALKVTDSDKGSAARVSVVFGAEVVDVDCDAGSVALRSGQIHAGDAIIGADGPRGVVRRILMEAEDTLPESATGIVAYSSFVPHALVLEHNLGLFLQQPGCTVWFGANRALRTFPMGPDHDVSILLYTPDSSQNGTWVEEADKKIIDVLGPCDEHIRKLAALAGPATCVQIKQHYELESWVSESGRLLAIGDAAHPFSPGTGHSYATALEDGAFIGKIFSHSRDPDRVPEFLRAFQEHREPRCSHLRKMEKEYIFSMTVPDGEFQAGRDASMRALHAAGQNVLGGDLEQMLEDYQMMYGYDAADDADEWWMSFGRYHRSSVISSGSQIFGMGFSSFTTQVDEHDGVGGASKLDQA
ncbi:hypothetical protein C8F04DRAFT_1103166 [Mycena alexandri]|uniref:FAD-binding domain-containing protein n=1 Tax=Mycena alexandri TaxID=1745969 RepID=A0AAD6SX26_9AGAR|nr:hypothetical protein C8F04DRAFT_1103166 [Mycena alexandri]